MLVVRPAGPADLDFLLELAILSGPGFTSLPEDPDQLIERLDLSRDSFGGRIDAQQRWYTLMLEESDTGDVDGIGSVKAAVGLNRPFFSFRVVNNAQSSPSLGIKLEVVFSVPVIKVSSPELPLAATGFSAWSLR